MSYQPLSEQEEKIARALVKAAFGGFGSESRDLMAVETMNPAWQAQILSHFKLTGRRPGFLINILVISDGIKRFTLQ